MRILMVFLFLKTSGVVASDTMFVHPIYPPIVFENGEYNFYKYTPKYIPENLLHCFKILSTSGDVSLERFIKRNTNEVVERGIFDRGYRIRKDFCLEGYSSFAHFFHQRGIYYPFAMESYILLCFHDYLNQKKIKWIQNKNTALEGLRDQNKAWKKRTRQLFKTQKPSEAEIISPEPEWSVEELMNWY
ncbi:MAG: hypothetical protein IPM74_05665 [Crocinitomicaceae bacterium]|nr:hypothetical protein [Crocinitomicaceae bacterium]MBK8925391.1 hypothetical protein [Crocinitomicaceae bacterium]